MAKGSNCSRWVLCSLVKLVFNDAYISTKIHHRQVSPLRRPPTAAIAGRARVPGFGTRVNRVCVRAVISEGDKKKTMVETSKELNESAVESGGWVDVRAVITIRKKMKENLNEKIEDQWEYVVNGMGQGICLQLISDQIDPVTKSGKSIESYVRGWMPKPLSHPHIVAYMANFKVPHDFGCPGAILITNFHGKEFYLTEIVVHGFKEGPIFFPANSWIHSRKDNPESRIIFKNKAYIPSQTPPGIKDLRREDLLSIRGNGKGERKMHDRIYDYAPYNDLGNPDKGEDLARPVLSGEEMPYPRRCRTGRPPTKSEPFSESRIEKPHPVYVPRDETFEEIKQNTFSAGRLKALLHNLIPSIASALSSSDISFKCFSEIDKLYNDGVVLKDEEQNIIDNQFLGNLMRRVLTAGQQLLKYEIPAIIKSDRFVWLRDNEFARQTLAGGQPKQELHLHRMSVEEAIENKRLFILDYHDMLLPFMERMNSLPGRKAYASRTVFVCTRTDYPYAADGLLIWSAIKELVESYVEHFYPEPGLVTSDLELQAWWNEVKNKGHYDKRNEPWWPKLDTKEDLCGILTTMIWIASGQHAAINFGQYPFGGYVPNRPTLMRKLIPHEDEPEYEKFIHNPQRFFLSSLPTQLQATKVMAVQDTLSTHSPDEEYLGQVHHLQSHCNSDHQVQIMFKKFSSKLEEIEKTINARNKDIRLRNRSGAGIPPYELLLPLSGPGVTGRGIPNSVSI
ncbi:PLAT/LH2 domain-containing lipoxygenase family protein [Actinidia rufa]|uniref:PLAT/LH2 domain-containing lipoxygenase family protein n=1 Tax=Actinidia rufa TaxID=165716 RepID=A0A7J0ENT0_9ERIC|nr:PLAT/LH2 domain-containing lipoxygenase family protein [Actinidia rufa]